MQIDITGHQMEVTAALKTRVSDSLGKLARHTSQAIDHAHVVLQANKQSHQCALSLSLGGDTYTAKEEGDNLYAAIDRVVEKVQRQMNDGKSRHKDARRR